MKFTKDFRGVPAGEIYPVQYKAGDECPPELETAAIETGAVEAKAKAAPKGKGAANANPDD